MRGLFFRLCCLAAACTAAASELGESALCEGDLRNGARYYRDELGKAEPGSVPWRNAAEQLIRIAIDEGDGKAAKELCGRLDQYEKPDTPRMRALHAALLYADGEYAKAAEEAAKPTVPAATKEEALRLFSLQHRALLALQQYEAAEKAAIEFCTAHPEAGAQGKMLVLYSAILAGDQKEAQKRFDELEKMPSADGAALKKLRFLQQVRDQKEPVMPGADAPRPDGPDELLYTAYSLLADRAESAAKPAIAPLKLAAEAAPNQELRRALRSRLLNAYLSEGKKQEAADCAELLLEDTKHDSAAYGDALLRTARLRAEAGNGEAAVRFYQQAMKDDALTSSCRITAARECAVLHRRAKEFDKAQELFFFILKNGTTEEERQEGNFLLGEMAYSRGDYRGAVEFFRKSEQTAQWRDRSLFWLIQSQMQLNELSSALDAAETLAAVKDPDFAASGAYYRAVLLEKLNRGEEAVAAFLKFCSTYPKATYVRDALLRAASLQKEQKQYESAMQLEMDFAARFPGDDEAPAALRRAFEAAFLAGMRPRMEENLKQLMERYPHSLHTTEAIFREIDFLHAAKRDAEALAMLDKLAALQKNPKAEQSAQILYERARLLNAQGRQIQALKELQTLQTGYPNTLRCADSLLLSASIHKDLGEYEQAGEDYRRAAALRPGGPFAEVCEGSAADCLYSRAALKFDEKLLDQASEIYRKLSRSGDFLIATQSLFKYALCLELAGKDEEALAIYNDMLYAAVAAKQKAAPWSPVWVSHAVYRSCCIYLDDGSASSAREVMRMLRIFRSLGVDTGENFDEIEKRVREQHRI